MKDQVPLCLHVYYMHITLKLCPLFTLNEADMTDKFQDAFPVSV